MDGHVRHPRLDCVVLLALAMPCCNASFVPDTLTDTLLRGGRDKSSCALTFRAWSWNRISAYLHIYSFKTIYENEKTITQPTGSAAHRLVGLGSR